MFVLGVGNTSASVGHFAGDSLGDTRALRERTPEALAGEVAAFMAAHDATPRVVAIAGSGTDLRDQTAAALESSFGATPAFLAPHPSATLAVPMTTSVDEPERVGQDRLLCAFAAYRTVQQACVVIDAGTAVTIDFVDGEGVFHGGVILPGCNAMLRGLHDAAPVLPSLDISSLPDPLEPFGRNTEHAMLLGAAGAVRGAARHFVERYAEFYDAYPQIVATGGDAPMLFGDDELIESIVPDLQLLGLGLTAAAAATEENA